MAFVSPECLFNKDRTEGTYEEKNEERFRCMKVGEREVHDSIEIEHTSQVL